MPRIGTSAAESSWPNVRWDHSADIEARPLRIINEIRGDGQEADYIRSLITNRTLAWTAEVRCPSTAFSHTSWACDPEMTVDLAELNDSVLNRDRFLCVAWLQLRHLPWIRRVHCRSISPRLK